MTRVYVAIGANLGDAIANARSALEALGGLPECRLLRASSLYRTPPMGPPGQPDYINVVAEVECTLEAHDLLDELQRIEAEHGRVREGERWGPRTLDLDILLFGDREIRDHRLTVPHAGIAERGFFLLPLAELAFTLEVPGHGRVAELLQGVALTGISRLPDDA
jgi:2-amino-4-hydroxy-6-hydroxymethyldihydropteridine diphosphokinase